MNKKFTIYFSALTLLVAFQLTTSDVYTNDAKAPAGRTGAPNELTCAKSDCHTDHPLNSGSGSISLAFSGGASYQPNTDYVITITVEQAGVQKHGFELTVLRDDNDAFTGSFASPPIDPRTIQWNVGAVSGRKYMTHNNADSISGVFTVGWKSPSVNVGTITLYAAGNCADGNMNDTIIPPNLGGFAGDFIYTTTLQINPAINFGIYEAGSDHADGNFVYNNLVENWLNVKYQTDEAASTKISFYNINGQLKEILYQETESSGIHEHSFDMANFPGGVYLILLQSGNYSKAERVIVE